MQLVQPQHSPLALLRQVRDVMHRADSSQARLNALVQVIAEGMQSDVCSIYFVKKNQWLELYATYGLKQEAVHQTSLRFGEGIVGEIARTRATLNLPEAATHPKYAYRPETGEERFHSFIGVPILYQHRVIGVLVVQSAAVRIYSEDQAETLQTIAMVLAEMAISSLMVNIEALTGQDEQKISAHYFSGLKISSGLAKAPVVLHAPQVEITRLISDNPSEEEERLEKAIAELQRSVDNLLHQASQHKDEQKLEIIEAYRLFTRDRGWIERMIEAIRTGLTAEAAVKKVEEEMHARMNQIESTYIRERMQDLEDLSNQLIYHLCGMGIGAQQAELPEAFIVVAKSIGPAELLEYANHKKIVGLIAEKGSSASHVAIIARMMDIPVVAGIANIASLAKAGDLAIVDGDNGEVYIRPPADVVQAIDQHLQARRQQDEAYIAERELPAVTTDGVRVELNVSIGLYLDAVQLARPDIDGVGLYRTELPYLASSDIPDVDEQKKMYAEVFRLSCGKPVIFRSFDIGGDKHVPYLDVGLEENPAMGWRATRVGLDRPVILRRQFRALIRAASGQTLCLMFPFIADVDEFDETRNIFDKEMDRARVEGYRLPVEVKLGSMIEIPSILYQLPELFSRVDFVSVGSNDLLQFLFASDRGSEKLSGRYDPLSPVVMRLMRDLAAEAKQANVDLGFCGAMASRPIEALGLLACGVTNLSLPISAVGPMKRMIRTVALQQLQADMDYWLDSRQRMIRQHLEKFAKEHGVAL